MRYDAVIIGAGMSGLAAGIRLALFGKRVCILERHTVWGGLNSFYKKGGYHFDVGLHAVTNWVRPGYRGPRLPLQRVERQLRIPAEAFRLEPQTRSAVVFDDARLAFTNDLEVLAQEIAERFPGQIDGFRRLASRAESYPEATREASRVSARDVLRAHLEDPLLVEMLLCPMLFYGAAGENDLDFDEYVVLFNSIFREGLSRPRRGVRQILDALVAKYAEVGGELRRRAEVETLVVEDGRVHEIVIAGGESIRGGVVLSSAGLVETTRLRSDRGPFQDDRAGRLGFLESVFVLDRPAKDLGFEDCILFFNRGGRFRWERPEVPVDLQSGVICCPGNYAHAEPLDVHVLRATHLADHRVWLDLPEARYAEEKAAWVARSREVVSGYGGRQAERAASGTRAEVDGLSEHVVYTDAFTPKTVHRFTGHANGAIYGSPHKAKSGQTDLRNLFLCGTDQGLVGIVGAMLSGITVANTYVLAPEGALA